MIGTGTNHKSRSHTHGPGRCRGPECYRLEQTSSSSTNQDSSNQDHQAARQESYRNYRNQDSYRDRYSDVPRPIIIDMQPSHHFPRYANVGTNTYQENHTTNHGANRDRYKANQNSFQNHSYRYGQVANQEPSQNHYVPDQRCYRESLSAHQEPHRDHYEVPRAIVIDTQPSHGLSRRYANGLIPGSACGSCSWQDCRALVCCVLTCGFFGRQQPCVPPNESSTDPPPDSEPEQRQLEPKPEPKGTNLPSSGSFRYGDVYFKGRKVNYPGNSDTPNKRSKAAAKGESQRPVSDTSTYLDVDDVDDGGGGGGSGGTDIDSLITKKLLELYKMHQIEQLAMCTSDQSFSRKTNEISDLINSIAQDYNLEEQEAECRLVHGVIRISTRKYKPQSSKGKSQDALLQPNGRRDGTLPDSGNETMTFTFSNDEPEMLVSDSTPSDELARKMRKQCGRSAYSSGTTTDFSGEPLLC